MTTKITKHPKKKQTVKERVFANNFQIKSDDREKWKTFPFVASC